jgi:hypothetical protein
MIYNVYSYLFDKVCSWWKVGFKPTAPEGEADDPSPKLSKNSMPDQGRLLDLLGSAIIDATNSSSMEIVKCQVDLAKKIAVENIQGEENLPTDRFVRHLKESGVIRENGGDAISLDYKYRNTLLSNPDKGFSDLKIPLPTKGSIECYEKVIGGLKTQNGLIGTDARKILEEQSGHYSTKFCQR